MDSKPRRPRNSLVLISEDIGIRAAWAVALPRTYPVTVSSQRLGASISKRVRRAAVVVVDVHADPVMGLSRLRRLDAEGSARTLVMCGSGTAWGVGAIRLPARVRPTSRRYLDLLAAMRSGGTAFLDRGRCSRLSARIVDHVAKELATASVAGVVAALHVSARHLLRSVRADFRMSLREFIARVHVEAAKCSLRETEDRLATVAERVGLYDAAHLARVFRKYVGQAPGVYRRRHRMARPDASGALPARGL